MGDTRKGTAIAEVGVLTGIAATKSALMEGTAAAEGMMMKGMTTVRAGAGGIGALVLATGEDGTEVEAEAEAEAEALMGGDAGVLLGKGVRKDVPRLSNGTGREKDRKKQIRVLKKPVTMLMRTVAMGTCRMVINMMAINSNPLNKRAIDTIISGLCRLKILSWILK